MYNILSDIGQHKLTCLFNRNLKRGNNKLLNGDIKEGMPLTDSEKREQIMKANNHFWDMRFELRLSTSILAHILCWFSWVDCQTLDESHPKFALSLLISFKST
jgi:hypothetical protein